MERTAGESRHSPLNAGWVPCILRGIVDSPEDAVAREVGSAGHPGEDVVVSIVGVFVISSSHGTGRLAGAVNGPNAKTLEPRRRANLSISMARGPCRTAGNARRGVTTTTIATIGGSVGDLRRFPSKFVARQSNCPGLGFGERGSGSTSIGVGHDRRICFDTLGSACLHQGRRPC